ncbi:MAG: hypothetical protein IPK13_17100 [Deltaproteobacteria bacterium]|nr:hypothetical protein [Deltaproteobacteria bacterium]
MSNATDLYPMVARRVSSKLLVLMTLALTLTLGAATVACSGELDPASEESELAQPVVSNTATFAFDEAIARGVVDFMPNPWSSRGYDHLVASLRELNPGLINRFGFLYGGPTQWYLDKMGGTLAQMKTKLPRAIMGAGFPEHIGRVVDNIYSRTFTCEPGAAPRTFTWERITSQRLFSPGHYWLDPAKAEAHDYLTCLGKIFVDKGFRFINFENPEQIVAHSSNPDLALSNLRAVQSEINRYASARGFGPIYWGGDSYLSHRMPLHAVYVPARFFHTTFAQQYQNKIKRPGVGSSEYSYVLSQRRIDDVKAATAPGTRIFFYIDNFDSDQDDLRRMMELDRTNRHFMLRESGRVARLSGVYFLPNLNHCAGCVPNDPAIIKDQCHIVTTPDRAYTQYDAHYCSDYEAIRNAIRPPNAITTPVAWINDWAICSSTIGQLADCNGQCIYHKQLYPEYRDNPLRGADASIYAYIEYRIDPSGYCQATKLDKLRKVTTRTAWINEYAVCSSTIGQSTGCLDWDGQASSCIWHSRTRWEYQHLDATSAQTMDLYYRQDSRGVCSAALQVMR